MPLPRSGTGTELYLIPTVLVPPTSMRDSTGAAAEGIFDTGVATPAATNTGSAVCLVGGRFRQGGHSLAYRSRLR